MAPGLSRESGRRGLGAFFHVLGRLRNDRNTGTELCVNHSRRTPEPRQFVPIETSTSQVWFGDKSENCKSGHTGSDEALGTVFFLLFRVEHEAKMTVTNSDR